MIKFYKKITLRWKLNKIKKGLSADKAIVPPASRLSKLAHLVIDYIDLLTYRATLKNRVPVLLDKIDTYYELLNVIVSKMKQNEKLNPVDFEGIERKTVRLANFLTWSNGVVPDQKTVVLVFCEKIIEFASQIEETTNTRPESSINNLRRIRPQQKNSEELLLSILEMYVGD